MSSRHSVELCPLANVLYFNLLCSSVSQMCPKFSEKPKSACKGVTLSVKLDVIKHIWYDLLGNFVGLETLKIFSI